MLNWLNIEIIKYLNKFSYLLFSDKKKNYTAIEYKKSLLDNLSSHLNLAKLFSKVIKNFWK